MRLVGFAFTHPDGPARWGYLELDDLTVVLGPNDTGKSRIVKWLASWLTHTPPESNEGGIASGALFAEVDDAEFDAVFAAADESSGGGRTGRLGPADKRLERLRGQVGDLAPMLEESRLLCFEPVVEREAWRVRLCLPGAAHALPASIFESLSELGLARGGNGYDMEHHLLHSIHEPPCLAVREAPAAVIAVGEVSGAALPAPVTAPREWPSVRDRLTEAISELADEFERYDSIVDVLSAAIDAASDGDREGTLDSLWRHRYALDDGDRRIGTRRSRWLEGRGDDAVGLRSDVRTAADVVREFSQGALPSFVGRDYILDIDVAVSRLLVDDVPVGLGLWRRDAGTHTRVEEAADGLVLWLQLALLEGADALASLATAMRASRRDLRELSEHLATLRDSLVEAEERLADASPGADERTEAREDIDVWADAIEESLEEITSTGRAYRQAIERFRVDRELQRLERPSVIAALSAYRTGSPVAATVVRAPLYLLDEPERHLHPALVPRAARWLTDIVRQRRSQAVVITHGVPFLTLERARFAYVTRAAGDRSEILPLDPASLTALSGYAEELGLDRGQLLANVGVVLFVEGRADQVVLEELYGTRLRQAGIAVTPLAGAGRHGQIFDSDLLARFTGARMALMLDNLKVSEARELLNDAERLEAALLSRKTELHAMASVIRNARQYERHVEPMTHPYADIFDVLDESTITELYPAFPGHPEATDRWTADKKRHPNRKLYYEQVFDIPRGLNVYEEISRTMRARGVRAAPELEQQIEALERYALEGDMSRPV